jgi:hypothetical protein
MLCDVISAVTEFMVRCCSSVLLGCTPLLGLKPGRPCEQYYAMHFASQAFLLSLFAVMHCVATLKGMTMNYVTH